MLHELVVIGATRGKPADSDFVDPEIAALPTIKSVEDEALLLDRGPVLQLDLVLDVVDLVQGIHPQYEGLAVLALHKDLEGGGSADDGVIVSSTLTLLL